MKVIYDDIIYSLQKSGGVSIYWQELEDRIHVDERLVCNGRESNIFYRKRDNETVDTSNIKFSRYKNLNGKELRSDLKEPFIFHSSHYRYCKNRNAVNITTLHDFTYEYYRKGLPLKVHHWQKKNAIMHSAGVICISQSTLNDLRKFIPEYKGQVAVIGHGYSKEYFYTPGIERQNKAVYVGVRGGYKNFKLAVEVVKRIPQMSLSIVGGGKITDEEKTMLEEEIPGRYEALGYVENKELAKLYNSCLCLLYTSDYEGFGIPALEAMACGCPVVCQKMSSLPEVCGEAGVYISKDADGAAKDVEKLLDKDYFEKVSLNSLSRIKQFSWEKTAMETEAFYKKVASKFTGFFKK